MRVTPVSKRCCRAPGRKARARAPTAARARGDVTGNHGWYVAGKVQGREPYAPLLARSARAWRSFFLKKGDIKYKFNYIAPLRVFEGS